VVEPAVQPAVVAKQASTASSAMIGARRRAFPTPAGKSLVMDLGLLVMVS
jgi:hypothetical protein